MGVGSQMASAARGLGARMRGRTASGEAPPAGADANIFISYRRDDSGGHTGRLYDTLNRQFAGQVFFDIDSMAPGEDFVSRLEAVVAASGVVLVVIGPEWSAAVDDRGRRRLDDPGDFVRMEIEAALAGAARVIPVLVQGAAMPRLSELPSSLAALSRRHAVELSDTRWSYDVDRLVAAIRESFGRPRAKARRVPRRAALVAVVLAGAAIAIVAALALIRDDEPEAQAQTQTQTQTQAPATETRGPDGWRVLRAGATGADVEVIQRLLEDRGFQPGGADGWFAAKTEDAVRQFQGTAGLPQDGVVTAATRAALMPNLVAGTAGEDVKGLQRALIRHGYYSGRTDGVFSARVAAAVERLQRSAELDVDGIVDDAVWTVLGTAG